MLQAGPDGRGQSGDPPEGHVQPPGGEFGRRAGQAAVVARDEFAGGGQAAGFLQDGVRRAHGDADVDQQRAVVGGPEGGGQVVVGGQHPARVREQPGAVLGEGDPARRTVEEVGAHLPFQPPDVAAQCLLGDVQPGGGAGEVQFVGDGGEGAEQARVEVSGHAHIVPPARAGAGRADGIDNRDA